MRIFNPAVVSLWWALGVIAVPMRILVAPPAEFTPNTKVGPGGSRYKDSPHFRVYDAADDSVANTLLQTLESAYDCFVLGQGWRSTGLSFNQENDDGPWYKMNVYDVANLGANTAANTGTDSATGLSFLNVVTQWMNTPSITVHEFGHALTYAERYWINQGRTGAWWETIANFVADTFVTSSICEGSRSRYNQSSGDTLMNLKKVIGDSYQVIVDGSRGTGNYYEAWPFLTYITNNPDNYPGLGMVNFPNVWRKYKRDSNETPLHILDQLSAPTKIQTVVGRYWARMAYVDIGHEKARALFERQKKEFNYANLDSLGGGKYRVKAARQPRYMGANIIPLKVTGTSVSVAISTAAPYTASLAIKAPNGSVRYIEVSDNEAEASVASGEEASLVIVNTPDSLYLYDPFSLTNDVSRGLDYQVQITGAST
ncbi:uncharacterized protein GGS22DRAFT_176189 [Annulohypoxylon maeteangense]|uniref:uncharacterized protein n=1 Tax=Annulohypoxylon maeteangense TaxID=1927788 RepID=UPI00200893F1|nr:uncharacterized protein GGS22DRAFT_176189 [Annulohypoxylon maeteangense]KAI0880002.1 hypothetical protein GGS22DRAFT_176189 [Annulohypoxylon maeteangense]